MAISVEDKPTSRRKPTLKRATRQKPKTGAGLIDYNQLPPKTSPDENVELVLRYILGETDAYPSDKSAIRKALHSLSGNERLDDPATLARYRHANDVLQGAPLSYHPESKMKHKFRIRGSFRHPLAACAALDPDLFYPGRGQSTREIRKICKTCQAQPDCLEHALVNSEKFGFWGGKSERERRQLRKERELLIPTDSKPDNNTGSPRETDNSEESYDTTAEQDNFLDEKAS